MKQSIYSLHPAYAMEEAIINNLIKKSGRSLEEWYKTAKKIDSGDERQLKTDLIKQEKLSTNQAMFLVERYKGRGGAENYNPEALVNSLFTGSRIDLRPLYDKLIARILDYHLDIQLCPAKSVVSIYGNLLFANLKPTTKTRIDFGFALRNEKFTDKLKDTGGYAKNDKITHRMEIRTKSDVNSFFDSCFMAAYKLDLESK